MVASCYDPTAPANAPCPDGECPSGQQCIGGVCRIDTSSTDSSVDDGPVGPDSSDAPATTCVAGDGQCPVDCGDTDADCMTTCGDARCVGNAGELCGNCSKDCATLDPVCGNGACDPGESPSCYADCGPSPWTWTDEEESLISQINARRTGGTTCPGGTAMTAPALTSAGGLVPTAHEWVWEIAHQDVLTMGGGACNGRTNADRQIPADFDAYVQSSGYASVNAAINAWFNDSSICMLLMSTARTRIAAGVAMDAAKGYVVVLE